MYINFHSDIFNPVFLPLISNQDRFLVLKGGAGSGKSYFAIQKIVLRLLAEPGHRFVFTRKVSRTIRTSQYQLFKDYVKKYGLDKFFVFRETDMRITCTINGNEVFCVGLDDKEKIKSLAEPTGIWYEEPTELTEREFDQMSMRMRGKKPHYKQEILTFNPIDEGHWLKRRFFPEEINEKLFDKKIMRWQKVIRLSERKSVKQNITCCHTTFLDNKFMDDDDRAKLLLLKETDINYYNIYCLGKWGNLGNLVFDPPWEIKKGSFPPNEYFDKIVYGVDFGYKHPTVVVKVGIKDDVYHVQERFYGKGYTTTDFLNYCHAHDVFDTQDVIFCDNAEPDRIAEMNDAGLNAVPAYKGNNSIENSIDYLKSVKIFSYKENVNLNWEVSKFKYKETPDGLPIEGEYIKINDDCIAATRYAIYSEYKMPGINMALI